jgi:integrase/recombinase XerC
MTTEVAVVKGTFPTAEGLGIALHSWLDGSSGTNRQRAPGTVLQIAAANDLEAIEAWIDARAAGNEHTVRSYRREAFRLMVWCVSFQGKPISSMTTQDVAAFEKWLKNPTAHPDWTARGWTLFRGPLARASIGQAKRILLGLFRWLCESGYLAGNPFAIKRSKAEAKAKRVSNKRSLSRYIKSDLWMWFQSYVDRMVPDDADPLERLRFERKRFIVIFLYWTALRRFELAQAKLGDVSQEDGHWILRVCGKGHIDDETPDEVVLLPPAMDALRRYLRARGLPDTPDRNDDDIPLVGALNGSPITGNYINRLLKELFDAAAEEAGRHNSKWKDEIKEVTAHWMRHSFATHSVAIGVPLQAVADQLRHSTLETTRAIYAKLERERRRKELKRLVKHNAPKPPKTE